MSIDFENALRQVRVRSISSRREHPTVQVCDLCARSKYVEWAHYLRADAREKQLLCCHGCHVAVTQFKIATSLLRQEAAHAIVDSSLGLDLSVDELR